MRIRGVLVVDVRDADELRNGRIPIDCPRAGHQAKLASVRKASKGRVVVTYCSCPTEASSLRAATLLTSAGITARALVGGFPGGWRQVGLSGKCKVTSPCQQCGFRPRNARLGLRFDRDGPLIRKCPRPQSWEHAMSKRPASVGVNHTGESSPGVASVFTRMAGTPKLWITSLLVTE